MESAYELLASKTLTISKLLVLAPPGTIDPTPHLYDTTMYTLSGLMATAVIAHSLVRPIKSTVVAPTVIDVKSIPVTPIVVNNEQLISVVKAEEVAGDRLKK